MTHLEIVIEIAKQIKTFKFGKLNSTGVCMIANLHILLVHNIKFRIVFPQLKFKYAILLL